MSNVLTGIKPTGMPHLGNYLSVIKPAIERVNGWGVERNENFFFIADYHALTSVKKRIELKDNIRMVAATWLASGLMTNGNDNTNFYVQSDVPEIFQLSWILSCYTPKGFLNRAHAYKSAVDKNLEVDKDEDQGIDAGLYNYPVLMAADILLFKADQVPVGLDQIQHIEIARDIAQRFNHRHKKALHLPKAEIIEGVETILGLDGRKMSKSYDNTIPLCCSEKKLKKLIKGIPTDSADRNAPKSTEDSLVCHYFKHFGSPSEVFNFELELKDGMAWGDAKEKLFQLMNTKLAPIRDEFDWYMNNTGRIDQILEGGRDKVRRIAKNNMEEILNKM